MPRLPACKPADVIRALGRAGFVLDHSTGSHRFFRHPTRAGLVVVAFHRKDLKRGTLRGIIEQAGLSVEQFIALL
jgi:predicted RNA binding protein YcfA (HicA-like mRNA interferase family)